MMIRLLFLFSLILGLFTSSAISQPSDLMQSAQRLLENEELKAYRGWIKYLIFDVEVVAKRTGITDDQVLEKQQRLESWVQRIQDDPNVIDSLRGVQEWAYESPADGSGQPFMITIPQDYDRHHAMPVSLYMHGYSGNHSEYYTGSDTLRGMFELSVLGRGRGGSYLGLSEADVIDVLDYVERHWNIDPDRVHILGGSMGGHGTFRMASRFPHRFASARPSCGYASGKPFGNLITLPIYATHSDDDFSVPILHAKGPLERLQELGGQVICDWTTGYGHAVWDYTQGNARADQWFRQQVRPSSKSIRHLNFTAFDGVAKRSWWAEIEEWGNEPKPAQFVLKAGHNNTLYAQLTNIRQLKLSIAESPFIATQPLRISVNGAPLIEKDNPLPDVLYLSRENGVWQLKDHTDKSEIRRHTPGGPNLLYNGDPLLIVYGTRGSQEENHSHADGCPSGLSKQQCPLAKTCLRYGQ